MTISKSDYMLFLRHSAWLWLKKYQPERLPQPDANLQAIFDTGHRFEAYAEQLFNGAVKLGFTGYEQYLSLPAKTQALLDQYTPVILQGRLEVDGLTCIFDVLERVDEHILNLIEIKSSTKAKSEHFYDLAFQALILERSGWQINEISVLHVNNDYVRQGEIDPAQLTGRTEVTEEVKALLPATKELVEQAWAVVKREQVPSFSPTLVNQVGVKDVGWFKDWLGIYKDLHPDLDSSSIYHLAGLNSKLLSELDEQGIELLADIPMATKLNSKQVAQIQATCSGERLINQPAIKEFLQSLQYPLYFFDYETLSSAIPFFDGMKPYQDYPFQYSLHVLRAPDAKLEHLEYLHSTNSNPMPELIAKLKSDLGEQGSILAWNKVYEEKCNNTMAELYPEEAEFLQQVNERLVDLMLVFQQLYFVDKDFKGSASLKSVLPVLAPDCSYSDLNVSDGLLARRLWTNTILLSQNEAEKEAILKDLSAYCTLDTFGMVRIFEELGKVVG
jgi:hypothetical protein